MNTLQNPTADDGSHESRVQRLRTIGIDWTAGAMNWVSDHLATEGCEIRWKDRLRWWLEDRLGTVFGWFYAGSDEEIQAVYDAEIPPKYMSARQRAVLTLSDSEYEVHCYTCNWDGWLDEAEDGECPDCSGTVVMEPLNNSAVRTPLAPES